MKKIPLNILDILTPEQAKVLDKECERLEKGEFMSYRLEEVKNQTLAKFSSSSPKKQMHAKNL
ncbi:MAG: hypothetical protein LBJ97_01835 [Mycoplasmataceae bacterium]|jgi:hypothetical protein|nr:hypothetical protein [Mycoplasmataceae bacterium]